MSLIKANQISMGWNKIKSTRKLRDNLKTKTKRNIRSKLQPDDGKLIDVYSGEYEPIVEDKYPSLTDEERQIASTLITDPEEFAEYTPKEQNNIMCYLMANLDNYNDAIQQNIDDVMSEVAKNKELRANLTMPTFDASVVEKAEFVYNNVVPLAREMNIIKMTGGSKKRKNNKKAKETKGGAPGDKEIKFSDTAKRSTEIARAFNEYCIKFEELYSKIPYALEAHCNNSSVTDDQVISITNAVTNCMVEKASSLNALSGLFVSKSLNSAYERLLQTAVSECTIESNLKTLLKQLIELQHKINDRRIVIDKEFESIYSIADDSTENITYSFTNLGKINQLIRESAALCKNTRIAHKINDKVPKTFSIGDRTQSIKSHYESERNILKMQPAIIASKGNTVTTENVGLIERSIRSIEFLIDVKERSVTWFDTEFDKMLAKCIDVEPLTLAETNKLNELASNLLSAVSYNLNDARAAIEKMVEIFNVNPSISKLGEMMQEFRKYFKSLDLMTILGSRMKSTIDWDAFTEKLADLVFSSLIIIKPIVKFKDAQDNIFIYNSQHGYEEIKGNGRITITWPAKNTALTNVAFRPTLAGNTTNIIYYGIQRFLELVHSNDNVYSIDSLPPHRDLHISLAGYYFTLRDEKSYNKIFELKLVHNIIYAAITPMVSRIDKFFANRYNGNINIPTNFTSLLHDMLTVSNNDKTSSTFIGAGLIDEMTVSSQYDNEVNPDLIPQYYEISVMIEHYVTKHPDLKLSSTSYLKSVVENVKAVGNSFENLTQMQYDEYIGVINRLYDVVGRSQQQLISHCFNELACAAIIGADNELEAYLKNQINDKNYQFEKSSDNFSKWSSEITQSLVDLYNSNGMTENGKKAYDRMITDITDEVKELGNITTTNLRSVLRKSHVESIANKSFYMFMETVATPLEILLNSFMAKLNIFTQLSYTDIKGTAINSEEVFINMITAGGPQLDQAVAQYNRSLIAEAYRNCKVRFVLPNLWRPHLLAGMEGHSNQPTFEKFSQVIKSQLINQADAILQLKQICPNVNSNNLYDYYVNIVSQTYQDFSEFIKLITHFEYIKAKIATVLPSRINNMFEINTNGVAIGIKVDDGDRADYNNWIKHLKEINIKPIIIQPSIKLISGIRSLPAININGILLPRLVISNYRTPNSVELGTTGLFCETPQNTIDVISFNNGCSFNWLDWTLLMYAACDEKTTIVPTELVTALSNSSTGFKTAECVASNKNTYMYTSDVNSKSVALTTQNIITRSVAQRVNFASMLDSVRAHIVSLTPYIISVLSIVSENDITLTNLVNIIKTFYNEAILSRPFIPMLASDNEVGLKNIGLKEHPIRELHNLIQLPESILSIKLEWANIHKFGSLPGIKFSSADNDASVGQISKTLDEYYPNVKYSKTMLPIIGRNAWDTVIAATADNVNTNDVLTTIIDLCNIDLYGDPAQLEQLINNYISNKMQGGDLVKLPDSAMKNYEYLLKGLKDNSTNNNSSYADVDVMNMTIKEMRENQIINDNFKKFAANYDRCCEELDTVPTGATAQAATALKKCAENRKSPSKVEFAKIFKKQSDNYKDDETLVVSGTYTQLSSIMPYIVDTSKVKQLTGNDTKELPIKVAVTGVNSKALRKALFIKRMYTYYASTIDNVMNEQLRKLISENMKKLAYLSSAIPVDEFKYCELGIEPLTETGEVDNGIKENVANSETVINGSYEFFKNLAIIGFMIVSSPDMYKIAKADAIVIDKALTGKVDQSSIITNNSNIIAYSISERDAALAIARYMAGNTINTDDGRSYFIYDNGIKTGNTYSVKDLVNISELQVESEKFKLDITKLLIPESSISHIELINNTDASGFEPSNSLKGGNLVDIDKLSLYYDNSEVSREFEDMYNTSCVGLNDVSNSSLFSQVSMKYGQIKNETVLQFYPHSICTNTLIAANAVESYLKKLCDALFNYYDNGADNLNGHIQENIRNLANSQGSSAAVVVLMCIINATINESIDDDVNINDFRAIERTFRDWAKRRWGEIIQDPENPDDEYSYKYDIMKMPSVINGPLSVCALKTIDRPTEAQQQQRKVYDLLNPSHVKCEAIAESGLIETLYDINKVGVALASLIGLVSCTTYRDTNTNDDKQFVNQSESIFALM